jgi:hypothetical protein
MKYSVTVVEFDKNLGNKIEEVLVIVGHEEALAFVESFNKTHVPKAGATAWLFAMNPIRMS